MNTPLPLDAADHAYARNWAPSTTDAEYHALAHAHAAGRATLAARVAELERDVVRLSCCVAEERMNAIRHATHANALRDALVKADAAFNAWGRDEDGIHPEAWPAVEHLRETLKAHPAASLAAHDAEVRYAAFSEVLNLMDATSIGSPEAEWDTLDARIRALAAQEVKP